MLSRKPKTAPRASVPAPDLNGARRAAYRHLFRKFVLLTLLCSAVPLFLVGWGINIYYTDFGRERMLADFETEVEYHRKLIEGFLNEHSSKLQLVAGAHTMEFLIQAANLRMVFDLINHGQGTISDLSVMDAQGNHRAYVGPYDLLTKNYAQEFWFKQVREKGVYISDMFLGFRKEPHFIIAVAQNGPDGRWILRATINTEAFRALVENVQIGRTGEAYLLNEEGVFQTSPRFSGEIMGRSAYPIEPWQEGIQQRTLENVQGPRGKRLPKVIACQTWLKNPRWLLVVQQEYAEALADVTHANTWSLVFLFVSTLSILGAAVLITRHMITIVKRRDAEADQLNQQLLQTGKLASIGELSAGVAHEINNPLAIILTERQLLLDAAQHAPIADPELKEQFDDSMSQIDIQIQRCKRITQNLLRFSRRTESLIDTVDLNAFVREVVDLMDREARSGGIKFFTELDPALPPLLSDPSQLQQVFLNLITNAIDAHDGKPYGTIRVSTQAEPDAQQVRLSIADTGSGISPEHLSRIFDPFFTTKPVGKGTGLGLSICYSIIRRLGGTIEVESEKGKGTTFTIVLPFTPPKELRQELAGDAPDQRAS